MSGPALSEGGGEHAALRRWAERSGRVGPCAGKRRGGPTRLLAGPNGEKGEMSWLLGWVPGFPIFLGFLFFSFSNITQTN